MKKALHLFMLTIISLSLGLSPAWSWEPYDRVIAVVNSSPIVESEINDRFEYVKKAKKVSKKKTSLEKSRVLDKFIEDELVAQTAQEISIIISDKKVLSHIETMMKQYFARTVKSREELENLTTRLIARLELRLEKESDLQKDRELDPKLNKFIAYIEKTQKMEFTSFIEEARSQMRREQLMSIAIGVSPPSKKEAMKWYRSNKKKMGYEVRAKHILIRVSGRSLTQERKANKQLTALRNRILKGESFEKLARKYSQDPGSAAKGGDLGWVMLAELDPYFAGNVNRMKRIGQISQVFKSSFGYHIVKYMGRRDVTFEKVEKMIMYRLYNEKMIEQFKKWVAKRKKESEIKIYMENYKKG